MTLEVLGSSSSGNCYLFRASNGKILIVECGVAMLEVKKALGWSLDGVVGCLVSHEHNDHAGQVKEMQKCGIPVLALEEVFVAKKLTSRVFCHSLKPKQGYRVGDFKVFTLSLAHDVPCLGFIIEHAEMGKTLFVTDTMMVEYRVNGLNHIMLEANYADDILTWNIDNGIVPPSMRDRLLHSHLELQTAKDIIAANDLTQVADIVLLHLSSNNSNLTRFRDEMMSCSGKPVYVATRGLKIDFSITQY